MVDYCEPNEISRCEGDENVLLNMFSNEDVIREIDSFEEFEAWTYENTFKVIEINDGRYAWVCDYKWGTCELCEGSTFEVIVSDDLYLLWRFALTDEARHRMSKLYNEIF